MKDQRAFSRTIDEQIKIWWRQKRRFYNAGFYNAGLIVAGILAFLAYAVLVEVLPNNDGGLEITLFTTAFQGFGYLFMMLIANLFYNLGPFVDRRFNHKNSEIFRRKLFILGCTFSFALPFSIPLVVLITSA